MSKNTRTTSSIWDFESLASLSAFSTDFTASLKSVNLYFYD